MYINNWSILTMLKNTIFFYAGRNWERWEWRNKTIRKNIKRKRKGRNQKHNKE